MAALSVGGCALFEGTPKKMPVKHKTKAEEKVSAEKYVENLSLARLELAQRPADIAGLSPRLTVVKNYMAQTKAKPQALTLVDFTYTQPGKDGTQEALAPISLTQRQFPSLSKVMDAMGAKAYRLQNIRVVATTVEPDATLVTKEEPLALAGSLEAQQQTLLAQSGKLSAADDIMTQIALIEYFTDHRQQDAAYLTLENVKRMLATATQDKTLDEESLTTLSAKLGAMESHLKQRLPYTF